MGLAALAEGHKRGHNFSGFYRDDLRLMREKEKIYPVYLLYGVEEFLIEEQIKILMDHTLSPQQKGLNLHHFNGEEQGSQEILSAAQTLPMFSTYRFVLIQKADQMSEQEVEEILKYLQNPSPSTCLVLRAQDAGPWKKHLGKIEKVGKVIEFPRLKGKALTAWMRRRAEAKGKALSEEAANYLGEVIGDHLQDLENTLEKVLLSVEGKRAIQLSDVEGFVSDVKVSTVYELTDAIGQQNLEKATGILRKVLGSKSLVFRKDGEVSKHDDPAAPLLGMMARQYRLIWRVKEMLGRRQGPEEIAGSLRVPVWNVRKVMDQAKAFSEAALREGLLKCQRTDLALKRGRGPRDLLMEKLVIDLCRPDQKARR
jgi:DNA polymerase-3 subunit delta